MLSATTLEQLRAIPPASGAAGRHDEEDEAGETTRFSPVVDGYFLPESPAAIFAAGKQNDVPMLAGWNRDEGGYDPKVTVESFKAAVEKQYPEGGRRSCWL